MFNSGKEKGNPEDIPREDLLNLCMKLNKRMKSLELKGQEMLKKYKTVLGERNDLMELITVTTDIPIGEGEDGNIDHIKDILLHHLNSHKIKNKTLNDKINVLEEKLEVYESERTQNAPVCQLNPSDSNVVDSKRQEDKIEKLKNKVYDLEMALQEKHTMVAYLEKKIDMASSRSDSTPVSEEKDRHVQSLEATIAEQERKLTEFSNELRKLRQGGLEAERISSASSLLKAEQEALLFSLRKDLKAALQSKEDSDNKVRELTEYRIRSEGKLGSMAESVEKLSQSEADLDEANALIKRLKSRLHLAETNLAVRAADMASKEEEIASLQTDLANKQRDMAEAAEALQGLRDDLSKAEEKACVESAKHSAEIMAKQDQLGEIERLHKESMALCQSAYDASITELKNDAMKKSQEKNKLLEEKMNIIRKLSEHNTSLKEEVESGQPADRKIFEMASRQAVREGNLHSSRDAREVAFQQLQSSLAAKDFELARLQDSHSKLMSEVAALRCVKNRETVNMDYLKNVVLQYMSFPSSSPERAGLVPVISLLLQFNEEEAIQATSGASKESLLWSTRPVKELKIHPPNRP